MASDGADPDRAVATQDQADLSSEDGLTDSRRGVAGDLDHPPQILGVWALAVRAPAPGLAVAVVGDLETAVAQPLDQARLSQGGRRLLLPGRERARAGGYADHSHLAAVVAHPETH
jgi:hypothetical protein